MLFYSLVRSGVCCFMRFPLSNHKLFVNVILMKLVLHLLWFAVINSVHMLPSTWAVGKQDFSHMAGETETIVSSWDVRTLFASVTKYDKFKVILKTNHQLVCARTRGQVWCLTFVFIQACSQQLLHKTPSYRGQNVCRARGSLWPHPLRTGGDWGASMYGRQGETVTKVIFVPKTP